MRLFERNILPLATRRSDFVRRGCTGTVNALPLSELPSFRRTQSMTCYGRIGHWRCRRQRCWVQVSKVSCFTRVGIALS